MSMMVVAWPVSEELEYSDCSASQEAALMIVVGEQIELYSVEREPADSKQCHDQSQHHHDSHLLLQAYIHTPQVDQRVHESYIMGAYSDGRTK